MGPQIVIPIAFFATIITFLYLRYSTRHKERMALIESGRDAQIFDESSKNTYKKYSANSLKYGLFLLFIGFGFGFGFIIEEIFNTPDAVAVISMVCISGGLGLLTYYWIVRQNEINDGPV